MFYILLLCFIGVLFVLTIFDFIFDYIQIMKGEKKDV